MRKDEMEFNDGIITQEVGQWQDYLVLIITIVLLISTDHQCSFHSLKTGSVEILTRSMTLISL